MNDFGNQKVGEWRAGDYPCVESVLAVAEYCRKVATYIHITAANGSVYLMSEAETKRPKSPFTPFPAAEIGRLALTLNGAA